MGLLYAHYLWPQEIFSWKSALSKAPNEVCCANFFGALLRADFHEKISWPIYVVRRAIKHRSDQG